MSYRPTVGGKLREETSIQALTGTCLEAVPKNDLPRSLSIWFGQLVLPLAAIVRRLLWNSASQSYNARIDALPDWCQIEAI
jgi:hypothetical protein